MRFEGEEGAGSGPVREFLLGAVKIADEGIANTFKPIMLIKVISRIIGHCALHGGPALHGLSPAIKYYLASPSADMCKDPPPISVEDIPDTDLRHLISEVSLTLNQLK